MKLKMFLVTGVILAVLIGGGSSAVLAADPDSLSDSVLTQTEEKVSYSTHAQNIGWQPFVYDGTPAGTEGLGLRLEAIKIESELEGVGIEYATHVENKGWQSFVADGALSGTAGEGLRLEAIKIRLTGVNAGNYDVCYRVHVQNVGWMGWSFNGEESGTAGYGYRMEGVQIYIVEKESDYPFSPVKDFPFQDAGDWQQKYFNQLLAIDKASSEDEVEYYSMTDLDGDGIPELIVSRDDDQENDRYLCDFYAASADGLSMVPILNPYSIYADDDSYDDSKDDSDDDDYDDSDDDSYDDSDDDAYDDSEDDSSDDSNDDSSDDSANLSSDDSDDDSYDDSDDDSYDDSDDDSSDDSDDDSSDDSDDDSSDDSDDSSDDSMNAAIMIADGVPGFHNVIWNNTEVVIYDYVIFNNQIIQTGSRREAIGSEGYNAFMQSNHSIDWQDWDD